MTGRLARSAALALLLALGGCGDGANTGNVADAAAPGKIAITITSSNGRHVFSVETAETEPQQQRGLMFRTDIPHDGGMLFAPYPPSGPPREASFWMKDTPSPLDILFIRTDGTIAHIAENTAPNSQIPVGSGEPVGAVLELRGGRALELGIAEGDHVSWAGRPRK